MEPENLHFEVHASLFILSSLVFRDLIKSSLCPDLPGPAQLGGVPSLLPSLPGGFSVHLLCLVMVGGLRAGKMLSPTVYNFTFKLKNGFSFK